MEGGEILGMEALVHWEHPERGLVGPDEFIPRAEETALINAVDAWVLKEACLRAKSWQDLYPDALPPVVSVNLSARQFRLPDLIEQLSSILDETGLDPGGLQLEVTESVITDDVDFAADLMHGLKELGVRMCIDDFGKGYSSLTSLQRLPLDCLKIDRSFVGRLGENAQDTAMVRLMVDLAHTMDMRAVGEVVETPEQLARLRELGCDAAQGFYFWKPLPEEAATALLASHLPNLNGCDGRETGTAAACEAATEEPSGP